MLIDIFIQIIDFIYTFSSRLQANIYRMQDIQISEQLSFPINRDQIVRVFEKYGYMPNAMINRQKMNEILIAQYTHKKGSNLTPELLNEIWNESEATSKGEILINTIADIILQAQTILGTRIQKLSSSNGMMNQLDKGIKAKQQQLRQHMDYFNEDRTRHNDLTKELISMQAQQKQNEHDLRTFKSDYETINKIFGDSKNININPIYQPVQTKYIAGQPNATSGVEENFPLSRQPIQQQIIGQPSMISGPQVFHSLQSPNMVNQSGVTNSQMNQSGRLKIIFYINCGLLIVQMILMSSLRVSMLPLTAYMHSLYTLLIGLVASNSILYLLVHLLFSVAGDITFVILKFGGIQLLMPFENNAFFSFILLTILIITIIIRIILMILFIPFRNAYETNYNDSFNFMGYQFLLRPVNFNKHIRADNSVINSGYRIGQQIQTNQYAHYSNVQPYSTTPAQLSQPASNLGLQNKTSLQSNQNKEQKLSLLNNEPDFGLNHRQEGYVN